MSHVMWACALVFAFTVSGCGGGSPKTVPATGQVVFLDGSPVTSGRVGFRSTDAPPNMAEGVIGEDGTFRLAISSAIDGAIPGDYRAVIIPNAPDESGALSPSQLIDPKYIDFQTSGLKFSVTNDPEKNHFQIKVQRPRR